MIVYKHGDLLESDEKIIVHGCNAAGGFGSGFAGQVAKKYPEVRDCYVRDYFEHIYSNQDKTQFLGQWVSCRTKDDRTIINLITQEKYGPPELGPYVSYPAIYKGLTNIMRYYYDLERPNHNIIAMPKIGAGLAGGNWEIIEKIINDVSGNFEIRVYTL